MQSKLRPVTLRSRWYHPQHSLHEEFIHTKHSYQFYSLQNSEEGNITISEITWPKASVKEQLLACFLCFKGNTVIPFSFTAMQFLIFYYITSNSTCSLDGSAIWKRSNIHNWITKCKTMSECFCLFIRFCNPPTWLLCECGSWLPFLLHQQQLQNSHLVACQINTLGDLNITNK